MTTDPEPNEHVSSDQRLSGTEWEQIVKSSPKSRIDDKIERLSQRFARLERVVLERFDQDRELLKLEQHIGRFNIFDALRIRKVEIRHSNFLAWLLDPNESHGQDALFLEAILSDVDRKSPPERRLFNGSELEGADKRMVRVYREFHRSAAREKAYIDVLIASRSPRFVIAIENKIRSREGLRQLANYREIVDKTFPGMPRHLVYLTRSGDKPSTEGWIPYTHRSIYDTLQRVVRTHERVIEQDVLIFIHHYLNSIRTWLMEDEEANRLCDAIYKRHQRAIKLILQRVKRSSSLIVSDIESQIENVGDWKVVRTGPRYLHVIPCFWDNELPPIGKVRQLERNWLLITIRVMPRYCASIVRVAPTKDPDLRRLVIDQLTANHDEFGLHRNRQMGANWTTLARTDIDRWERGEAPDPENLLPKVDAELDRLAGQLAGVPDALRRIIETWKSQHPETTPPASL